MADSPLTSIGVQADPNYYAVYGTAVVSRGIQAQFDATNGVGLVSRGLIWQAPHIWFDPQRAANLTTGWTSAIGYSGSTAVYVTGWTASAGYSGAATVYATGWTASLGYAGSATIYATTWAAAFGYSGSTAAISTTWTFSQANNAVLFGEVPE